MKCSLGLTLVLSIAALCGCSMTGKPPSGLSSTFMDVKTNYVPVLVVQTNVVPVTTYQTNAVTVTVTNQQNIVEFHTNAVVVPVVAYETNRVLATNLLEAYTYTPNKTAQDVQQVGGLVGSLFGVGGLVSTGLALLFGAWARSRSSRLYDTSTSLAQTIETMRQFIQQLPNGTQYDTALVTWMQQHQAQTGVLAQVLQILKDDVDNPAAKLAAEQMMVALQRMSQPTAPPSPAVARM